MARTRVRSGAASQGFVTRYSETTSDITYLDRPALILKHECTDTENSPGKDHQLRIEKLYNNYQELAGSYPGANAPTRVTYSGLRPTWAATLGTAGAVLPSRKSNNLYATEVLNRSNPSRPDVDLGVTIAEMREAPQLLFKAGRNMLRNGANWYLSYSFGWKPLVNDLLDTLDVPPKIDQRVKYLEKAAREGGMRRRVNLAYDMVIDDAKPRTVASHYGYNLVAMRTQSSERRIWGTVRYTPNMHTPFPKTDEERRRFAKKAAYGLLIDPSTAWNLIPWSWLIDYFGSMGDVLSAYRNVVGLSPSAVCIMEHIRRKDVYEYRTDGYQSISGGTGTKVDETKKRDVVPFVLPELYQPILSPGQLSNLGALAVLRIPKDLLEPWDIPRPRRRR